MAQITINGSTVGTQLQAILGADDIEAGSDPSYQLCKLIYLYHPLGAKMAESPVKKAQSQGRIISVPNSPGDRVVRAFKDEWKKLGAEKHIFNLGRLARIYGIASVALLVDGVKTEVPVDYSKLADKTISFNVYDPLNTAGSLVLNQNTNDMDFMKVRNISVGGKSYHRSRACVLLNEEPIYIAYTASAFGFVGRSVYQRALFPLKTFLQTMLTDDLITVKLGVLVAKIKQPGSVVDNLMSKLFALKRQLLKDAATGNVLSVGPGEDIESLNFQNAEGPYKVVRTNVLKNIATSADMPAVMLENETLTEGFGEGKEDAKIIVNYIDGVREWLQPGYDFFTPIVQHRAWNKAFHETLKNDFPDLPDYDTCFYDWVNSYTAAWPNMLTEPESEKVKVDEIRLEAIVALVEALIPQLDQGNKATLIQWAADNFNELELLFSDPLELDYEAIATFEPIMPGAGGFGEEQEEPRPKTSFGDSGGVRRIADVLRQRRLTRVVA